MAAQAESRDGTRIRGLGAAIRQRREECQLTQEQLAEQAGLHDSYVSFLENDRRYPCWDVLCALSAALDIRLSLLIRQAEDLASFVALGQGRRADDRFTGSAGGVADGGAGDRGGAGDAV
jgi:transcriptional regulator with XRE-family HTH domain